MTLPEALEKYDQIYRNNVGEPGNFLIELVKELKKDLPYIEKKDKTQFKILIKKMNILGFKELDECSLQSLPRHPPLWLENLKETNNSALQDNGGVQKESKRS